MVVGLGNPGKKYEITRHNAGFLAVDLLCQQAGVRPNQLKCKSLYAAFELEGKSVVAMKPQTYMNLSGEAVRDMARAFAVLPERIIVVFDDAALAPGKVRIRRSGSDGGHNGIKSILYQLQTDAFPRIKIGIGSPDREQEDMVDWVMSPLEADTMKVIRLVPDIVCALIAQGVDAAMQKYNNFTP